jgi:hypothetical protein
MAMTFPCSQGLLGRWTRSCRRSSAPIYGEYAPGVVQISGDDGQPELFGPSFMLPEGLAVARGGCQTKQKQRDLSLVYRGLCGGPISIHFVGRPGVPGRS